MMTRITTNREFPPSFKLELRNHLMDALYLTQRNIVDNKLDTILSEQYVLVDYTSAKCIYRGTVYNCLQVEAGKRDEHRWDKRLPLHEQLISRMDNYLTEHVALNKNAARVGAFITRALNLCNTLIDMKRILPVEMHKLFPKAMVELLATSEQHLSDDDIKSFLSINDDGVHAFQQRLLMNLLFSRA